MPCKVDLFPCTECGAQVYCTYNNDCNDHKKSCSIAKKSTSKQEKEIKFDYQGMLCEALQLLEDWIPEDIFQQELKRRDPRLLDFMERHELKERTKIRNEALSKLTLREKRALGIKQ